MSKLTALFLKIVKWLDKKRPCTVWYEDGTKRWCFAFNEGAEYVDWYPVFCVVAVAEKDRFIHFAWRSKLNLMIFINPFKIANVWGDSLHY